MAVYIFNITSDEVLAKAGFTSASEAEPTPTEIDDDITAYAAELGACIKGAKGKGFDPATITATSDAELYETCRNKIIRRCAAEWLAGNERADSDLVTRWVEEFNSFLDDIRRRPDYIMSATGHGTGIRDALTDLPARSASSSSPFRDGFT